jgi:hypothetical protein
MMNEMAIVLLTINDKYISKIVDKLRKHILILVSTITVIPSGAKMRNYISDHCTM